MLEAYGDTSEILAKAAEAAKAAQPQQKAQVAQKAAAPKISLSKPGS